MSQRRGTGFKIFSAAASNQLGSSVSSAGDVNGDGLADLIVGETGNYNAYVIYGKTSNATVDINTANALTVASTGFRIMGSGTASNAQTGKMVSSAGDVNGDGFADLLVGPQVPSTGFAMVVYGSASGTTVDGGSGTIASSAGFKITGSTDGTFAYSGATAGDINGDGLSDLILGSYGSTLPGYSLLLGGTQWISAAVSGAMDSGQAGGVVASKTGVATERIDV